MDFAFREDHSAAADLDLTSGGGAAFTAVRAAVSVQMGENQGRTTHFFALDDLTVIAVFDEAVEIAVVGQCAVGSAGRGFFIDVIERRKVSRVAERFGCLPFPMRMQALMNRIKEAWKSGKQRILFCCQTIRLQQTHTVSRRYRF